jgi:nucleoside-diphosphate-sugar epimerase
MVGSAVMRHFATLPQWDVVAVSRRYPAQLKHYPELAEKITHLSVDLTDEKQCAEVFGKLTDVTHVVYAAVSESPDVLGGWQEQKQMQKNRAMLVNILEPLDAAANLEHVALLQGTKAYAIHIHWPAEWFSTPARESEPRHPHENFYWLHEDYLREKQQGKSWHWTIWRPQFIYGDPVGSNLNTLAPIVAYAALEREAGRDLSYPGGPPYPVQAIDSELIAEAIEWGTTSENARNEIFNLTNGDVMVWPQVWPVIADAMGMKVGEPEPKSMVEELPRREEEWAQIVDKYGLESPRSLQEYVGGSAGLVDWHLAYGIDHAPPPALVSSVKLRKAGFAGCIDTEDMLRKWITRLQELKYIPAP